MSGYIYTQMSKKFYLTEDFNYPMIQLHCFPAAVNFIITFNLQIINEILFEQWLYKTYTACIISEHVLMVW